MHLADMTPTGLTQNGVESLSGTSRTLTGISTKDILKCPACNKEHHPKTDVFCNSGKNKDYDAREVFGITATCPICLDDVSNLLVLPCGHILCKDDYRRLGGFVRSVNDQDSSIDDSSDSVLVTIRRAGQRCVNGTYQQDGTTNKYTQLGRWNGEDAEFSIETRAVKGRKMWFITCRVSGIEEPIDIYKAPAIEGFNQPSHVRWESATLHGIHPLPRTSIGSFPSSSSDSISVQAAGLSF